VTRHRLNRSGDRQLNRALHTVVVARLREDPQTRIYAARRQAEGKSVRDVRRCLKRVVARQLFNCWSAATARWWNWRTSHSQVYPLVVLSCLEQSWRSRDHSCREVRVVDKKIGVAQIQRRSPVMAPSGTPRPRWPCHGAITHRRHGVLIAVLVCLLAACTSPDSRQAAPTSQGSPGPIQRDYWPMAGWRTAAPKDQGMDPAVVGELDAKVSGSYPQVRSLLVVRHGYLVYERYWHGLDASDGHNSFSVTKSFTSALVGIALEAGHLRGLNQTVGELLGDHLPLTPIRSCAGSPSSSY
jgi:hypothetical protein